jgi:hypothetical protein
MNGSSLRQRCWNHPNREAVCRCPECGRPFCRECVTEHDARLLCAGCLQELARRVEARPGLARRLAPLTLFVASLVFSWILFLTLGTLLSELTTPHERTPWQAR